MDANNMKWTFPVYMILILFTACGQDRSEADGQTAKSGRIDSLLSVEFSADRFSGSVAVSGADNMQFAKAYGIADRNFEIPMGLDSRSDIASLNKSMVGMLVMIAVEEEKLTLDDRLTDILSDYEYSGNFHDGITIHQMLTHTSGLPDYDAVNDEFSADGFLRLKRMHFTNEEYVDFISQLMPAGDPGAQFHYSNFAYHLLSLILEERYQTTFGDLIEQKIFKPLGMNTSYSTTDNQKIFGNTVKGYIYRDGEWFENPFIDLSIGRRVFSTATDLIKWGRALNEPILVSASSLERIKTNHLSDLTSDLSYGYGWVVFDEGESFRMGDLGINKPYLIHGGSTDGYKSLLVNINNGEWVIAILANSGNRTNELQLGGKITRILLNQTNQEN